MTKIPSSEQMKELDAYTIEHEPISSWDLMERAATAVTYEITARWKNRRIVIFAGPGNNGGDALAVARLLIDRDIHPETYLFNVQNRLSEDCATNSQYLRNIPGANFQEINGNFQPPILDENTLIIDGLFGTGLSQPLSSGFASLARLINASPAEVVSIDMPSGLMCENNAICPPENIVRANLTLTFQLPKLAQLFADNQMFVGELKILDIKLSEEAIENLKPLATVFYPTDIKNLLRARNPFGHKGTFGHACLIAGSQGMAGAAILAAKACLRSGVGKLTIQTPTCNHQILQITVPEAVISKDGGHSFINQTISTDSHQAMAIGPGLGTAPETAQTFFEQIRKSQLPMIIDADGVNLLSLHKEWIQHLPQHTILTPHPLELRRLTGCAADGYSQFIAAQKLATTHRLYIILKGHFTGIFFPNGFVHFNATGNSGMATAGSGDVLTGILLSLLAQGYTPADTCLVGVCLHGLAGDLAADSLCEESMIASDLITYLPQAFKKIRSL